MQYRPPYDTPDVRQKTAHLWFAFSRYAGVKQALRSARKTDSTAPPHAADCFVSLTSLPPTPLTNANETT